MNLVRRSWEFLQQHQLSVLIIGSVMIALVTTVLSIVIYVRSGAVLLDLSRPGYEPAREQIQQNGDQPQFETDGEMDVEKIESFRRLYHGQMEDVNNFGDFHPRALKDKQLYLN